MNNSLNNGSFQQYWSRRMQRKHQKEAIFRAIANFEEEKLLKQGDTVNRPYRSGIVAQAYTRGTAVTITDLTNTNETLTVSKAEIVPFYIDDLDELQSNYKFANEYADDAAVELMNIIDGDILSEYAQASTIVDDRTINGSSGTAGNGIVLDVSNVQKVFSSARAKFGRLNTRKKLFAVLSPDDLQVLVDYLAGKNSNLGDSTGLNGNVGKYYGFDIYESNNLTWTADFVLATQPNDGDTITLKQYDRNGVLITQTLTFKTTLGVTSGNILIGGSANAARTNLAALLSAPSTTTTTGVALATAFTNALGRAFVATNDAATKVTIVGAGQSFVQVSTALTASSTDGFTAAKQVRHMLFGSKGATDIVIQQRPKVEFKEVPDKLGKNCLPWTLYGYKTFNEGKAMLVDIPVRTDTLS